MLAPTSDAANAGRAATLKGPTLAPPAEGVVRGRPLRASIWAQDQRGIIGDGQTMLWHVPADFRFFKSQTVGCPVIMGRASFEALGAPLPSRTNIVLTRDADFTADGIEVVHSLEDGFALAEEVAKKTGAPTVWVAGGAQVYGQAMSQVDRLVVTVLDLTVPDTTAHPVYAPPVHTPPWEPNLDLSDPGWRDRSGDARWKVLVYDRAQDAESEA